LGSPKPRLQQARLGVEKFGQNIAVGTSDETVWDGQGIFPHLGTWDQGAAQCSIAAADARDTEGGLGSEQITIYGLDADGNLQQELVTLSGTNSVTSSGVYSFVHRMHVEDMQSEGFNSNKGTITLAPVGTGFAAALILPLVGQTQMAVYKIPRGMQGIMKSVYATGQVGAAQTFNVHVWSRAALGKAWRTRFGMHSQGAMVQYLFTVPVVSFPSGTVLELQASTSVGGGAEVDAGFSLDLYNN